MNSDITNQHDRTRHEHRRASNLVDAGEYYTAATHQYFSKWFEGCRRKSKPGRAFFLLAGKNYTLTPPWKMIARTTLIKYGTRTTTNRVNSEESV